MLIALLLAAPAVTAHAIVPYPRGQIARAPMAVTGTRIWNAACATRSQQIELLSQLVNIDTGTGDSAGWEKAIRILIPILEAAGMTVALQPGEAEGLPGNIVATLTGRGKRRILIIAHIDTVFEPNTAVARPFRRDEIRAYGPGVSDEKAGLVTAISAVQLLRALRIDTFGTVTLLIDSSEERGSAGSRKLIASLAIASDMAFNMEPGQNPDGVVVWRKGSGAFRIDVEGRAAHAGVAPQLGRNAAMELLHQLEILPAFPAAGDGLTVNLTTMSAGTRANVIPDAATARLNVRVRTKSEIENVAAILRDRAAHPRIPQTKVTVTWEPSFPPLPNNPATEALARSAQHIYAELGLELGTGGNGGGSESALVFEAAIPVLDGMGPPGGGFHSDAEYLDLSTLTPRLYLLTRLIEEQAR